MLQQFVDGNGDPGAVIQCELCDAWVNHIKAAKVGRKHYQDDATAGFLDDTRVRSVDLQKVIMLP